MSSDSAFREDKILWKRRKAGKLSKVFLNRRREGQLAKEGSAGGASVQLPAQAKPNEILVVTLQSLTVSTSQLLPGFMERTLIRPAACLGTTRILRLPPHSPCQRSPLCAPDSRSLFKASFKRKVATGFGGLGKRMNGLKLPNWKSRVGFAL